MDYKVILIYFLVHRFCHKKQLWKFSKHKCLDTETLYEVDEAMTREENGGFEVYELMKIEVDKQ